MGLIVLILSILIPPVGVFLRHGLDRDFWINLILTLIFFVPGVIHALYVNFARR
ncbi:YqaE/Pmp3 family membrane protein [Erythrobacter sp. HKB08]|uniref:YqaE/Pmp3 family membrane protein n=1 Tax=Erythrobacter sp. HKB08 TaxID=2502843 RepID=UPI0010090140|nr:YqaE/Pmp3 family membrane protein [Erythrobacter sp. HKB08]